MSQSRENTLPQSLFPPNWSRYEKKRLSPTPPDPNSGCKCCILQHLYRNRSTGTDERQVKPRWRSPRCDSRAKPQFFSTTSKVPPRGRPQRDVASTGPRGPEAGGERKDRKISKTGKLVPGKQTGDRPRNSEVGPGTDPETLRGLLSKRGWGQTPGWSGGNPRVLLGLLSKSPGDRPRDTLVGNAFNRI